MTAPDDPFITYQMADGSHIDEYSFVTELEWFDDRDREVRLIKRTYTLVSEEEIVLPDPYPIEDDDDDEPIVTNTGKVLTDVDIEALADEAERGYCVARWGPGNSLVCGLPMPCPIHVGETT